MDFVIYGERKIVQFIGNNTGVCCKGEKINKNLISVENTSLYHFNFINISILT